MGKLAARCTVLVTGAGGSMGIDVIRCLRKDPSLRVVGADGGPFGLEIGRRLCDQVVPLPRADRGPEAFADALDQACAAHDVSFVFVNPDTELEALAALGRRPHVPSAVPPPRVVGLCLDKGLTVSEAKRPELFPTTAELLDPADLERAFAEVGPAPLWLRSATGAGGNCSIVVESVEEARPWMQYWAKRGRARRWTLQEYLPGRNLNWTGFFQRGRLVAAAAMERLAYFLAGPTVSGISGQVSHCATVSPSLCQDASESVIRALDPEPSGFYSVDLRGDRDGKPRVTEVNPRLAGRPFLFQAAGVNFPVLAVRAFAGTDPGDAVEGGGLRLGVHLYRQLDVDPLVSDGVPELSGTRTPSFSTGTTS